jgi:hypothetical protein
MKQLEAEKHAEIARASMQQVGLGAFSGPQKSTSLVLFF